jgi:gliding motility-associated-like protein
MTATLNGCTTDLAVTAPECSNKTDTDYDGIADDFDTDDDNDGILDTEEGNGMIDSDNDGIPNSLDIDSDNDGITDNDELQIEGSYIPPNSINFYGEESKNAFILNTGGIYNEPVDTDNDGIPDYLDLDTDNDGIPDSNEGHDANFDLIPDVIFTGFDSDGDGLDDAYDVIYGWTNSNNSSGSSAALQDYDADNIRDWRDLDDDNDGNPTTGINDKLSAACELLIPEIFSPNEDGIQDYFRIWCIEKYPNAKIEIYNRWGQIVYKQENYGNTDVLGNADAWWDGYSNQEGSLGKEKLPSATYFYVLYLNDDSKPKNGILFLNR